MKKFTSIATITMASLMLVAAPAVSFAAENTTETESASQEHLITFVDATEIATNAAQLSADDVVFSKKMQTYEDGIAVYEIDFLIPNETKYEYTIDAKTGDIIDSEIEGWEEDDNEDYAALLAEDQALFDFEAAKTQIVTMPAVSQVIEEVAKGREEELCYYKDGFDYDDGRIVYVFGVMFPKEEKFEYKFDMNTGAVVDLDKDIWEADDNAEYRQLLEDHNLL